MGEAFGTVRDCDEEGDAVDFFIVVVVLREGVEVGVAALVVTEGRCWDNGAVDLVESVVAISRKEKENIFIVVIKNVINKQTYRTR